MKYRIILTCIIASLLFTNCLTMSYHSPRVVEPDAFQVGVGIATNKYDKETELPTSEIFLKYGMKSGYDFGVHLNTNYFPDGIGLSAKKQFDLNMNFIDAVNFEYGLAIRGLYPFFMENNEMFTAINILKENLALQFRMNKREEWFLPVLIGDADTKNILINQYTLGLFYELSWNNHNILLFIRGEYQNEYVNHGTFEQNTGYGGGISYYFNIK